MTFPAKIRYRSQKKNPALRRPEKEPGNIDLTREKKSELACKPGSVQPVNRLEQSFIWDACHQTPQATYPNPVRVHTCRIPIWSCSRRGLPCRELLPATRCALTAPFHPYRFLPKQQLRRSALCCTFRRLSPPRRYLAPYPMEPGLSSTRIRRFQQRLPGQLAAANTTRYSACMQFAYSVQSTLHDQRQLIKFVFSVIRHISDNCRRFFNGHFFQQTLKKFSGLVVNRLI